MSVGGAVRGAAAISVAFTLVVENGAALEVASGTTWSFSHLPRTIMTNFKPGQCGKQQPGYVTIAHAAWNSSWHTKTDSLEECKAICDANPVRCVGFEGHFPLHGKMRCKLYKGLLFMKDHIGLSFAKCTKAMPCHDQPHHRNFQFSHAGTWKGGTEIEELQGYEFGDCAKLCRRHYGCVGFTYRDSGVPGFEQCFHFLNEVNKAGPRHDLRVHSYFKCVEGNGSKVVQSILEEAPEALTENATDNSTEDFSDNSTESPAQNPTDNI